MMFALAVRSTRVEKYCVRITCGTSHAALLVLLHLSGPHSSRLSRDLTGPAPAAAAAAAACSLLLAVCCWQ
jgi:hypothetical protein